MAASASASYSMEDFTENAEAASVDEDEDSQISEEINEAASDSYSEEFAEGSATADVDKRSAAEGSRAEQSQSYSEHLGSQSEQVPEGRSADYSSPSSPPVEKPLSPRPLSPRPLVGIGSPPKPARRLTELAATVNAATSRADECDSPKSDAEVEESYPEEFCSGTFDAADKNSARRDAAASGSYSEDFAEGSAAPSHSKGGPAASASYSDDFAEGSAAEKSLSATLEQSEALSSAAEDQRRRSTEEAEARARVEERRRALAETRGMAQVGAAVPFTDVSLPSARIAEEAEDGQAAANLGKTSGAAGDESVSDVGEELDESIAEEQSQEAQQPVVDRKASFTFGEQQAREELLPQVSAREDEEKERERLRAEAEEERRRILDLDAKRAQEEEEEKRLLAEAEEERRRILDQDAKRAREEEEQKRLVAEAEEERRRILDQDAKRVQEEEEQKRLLAEAEDERRRNLDQDSKRVRELEEATRQGDDQKQRIASEDEKESIQAGEETMKEEHEANRFAEDEALRKAEEDKQSVEEELKRKADDDFRASEEAARQAEEERRRIEAEEERERKEAENDRIQKDEAARAAEEEQRRKAEEDKVRQRVEEELKRKADEEEAARKADEQTRRKEAEEDERKRIEAANEKVLKDAEAKIIAEEEARKAAEDKRRAEEDIKRKADEELRAVEEAARRANDKRFEAEEEKRRTEAEEERKRKAEEEKESSLAAESKRKTEEREQQQQGPGKAMGATQVVVDEELLQKIAAIIPERGSRDSLAHAETRCRENAQMSWGTSWAWQKSTDSNADAWDCAPRNTRDGWWSQEGWWKDSRAAWRWSEAGATTPPRWRSDDDGAKWDYQWGGAASSTPGWNSEKRRTREFADGNSMYSGHAQPRRFTSPYLRPLDPEQRDSDHLWAPDTSILAQRYLPNPYRIDDALQGERLVCEEDARRINQRNDSQREAALKDERWRQDLRLGLHYGGIASAHSRLGKSLEQEDPKANLQVRQPAANSVAQADIVVEPPKVPQRAWQETADCVAPGATCIEEASPLLEAAPTLGDLSPEDFGGFVALAVGAVVDNLLELKYNSGLDVVAFAKKVQTSCEGYASLSLERVINDLNAKPDLRFMDRRNEFELQLRLGFRRLRNFEELRRVVRLIPGTASAAAVITVGGVSPALDVVAAFRIAYSDSSLVVGRSGKGSGQLLHHFGQADFCGGVAIDPVIVSMAAVSTSIPGGLATVPVPLHAPEYAGLAPLLQYVQGEHNGVPAGVAPTVPPALLTVMHAHAPTEEIMQKAVDVLERPDVDPDGLLELLRKIAEWLKKEPQATLARSSFATVQGHKALVAAMLRQCAHRELVAWACRVIGWATRHHVENAVLFVEARAAAEVCHVLEQHRVDKDLHRHGLYAVGCLAHYGGGAPQAMAAGALAITLRSLATHRDSPSVHINGCEVLRCLAELGEAPMEDLGLAAQEAKRAFPRDRAVHRSADSLLMLVVPRTVGAVGALMDTKMEDAELQNSAARTLGQLAGYGGIAWKGCAPGAVSRIVRAMGNHRNNVPLQAVCLWSLGRLAERVEAPTAGMYDAADHARKKHPNSALVVRHADQLCAYLARP